MGGNQAGPWLEVKEGFLTCFLMASTLRIEQVSF